MIYNPSTTGVMFSDLTDQSTYDTYMCSVGKAAKRYINSVSEYVNNLDTSSSALSTISGFAINGVPFLTAASAEKTDPYYPQEWSGSSNG